MAGVVWFSWKPAHPDLTEDQRSDHVSHKWSSTIRCAQSSLNQSLAEILRTYRDASIRVDQVVISDSVSTECIMLHQQLSRLVAKQACSIILRRQQHVPSLLPVMLRSCIFHLSRIHSSGAAPQTFQSVTFFRGFSTFPASCAAKKPTYKKASNAAGDETCQVFDQTEMLIGQMMVSEAEQLARKGNLKLVDMGKNADQLRSLRLISGRELAEESKRQRLEKKSEKVKEKEFRITSNITEHDLEIKLRQAKDVLGRGALVKFVIKAHRRARQGEGDRQVSQLLKKVTAELEDQAEVKHGVRTQGEQHLLLRPLPSGRPSVEE
ncbi:hypothetical protein ACOMHN_024874 [Nucella lapillus]